MDINKLKEFQVKLHKQVVKELYEELPDSFIQFTNTDLINYCLRQIKVGTKSNQSARVLNNWIDKGVVFVNQEDIGKNKRFDRIESIWLNIVVEARKFGLPIESLRRLREDLTFSPVPNFSLLKLSILESIFDRPRVLLIYEEGLSSVLSPEIYAKKIPRGEYPTHIFVNFLDFIKSEFPNNALDFDFKIQDVYSSVEKMTMLYFLKTGDYKAIQLYLKDGDVRLVENSSDLAKNIELMKVISSWSFVKAKITLEDQTEAIITI